MFDIGFTELLLFAVIALIVLGPEKLPQAVRTAGRYYAKFRRTITTLQAEMEAELDLVETRQKMQEELAKIKQAEAQMKQEMAQLRGSIKQFEQSQQADLTSHTASHANNTTAATVTNPDITVEQTDKPTSSADALTPTTDINPATIIITRPWENMWFRLGDYDKARRLPPAPYLPNYQPDPLLNAPIINATSDITIKGAQ
ncbi:Sec-independent protein translocase protein TatB [Psychrobacter sp. I-STPA10]|uniref:Sec-independent protein translocase protein TatB n=1 Tax=Psychrobacter sp. I-STPA10 TaxID=2585769 RepID=UPI001E40DA19|nr:Sec-independent protein translocase protein TatB [Psychrobacter sp. I-STPA10]